jgi:hypothetical protein
MEEFLSALLKSGNIAAACLLAVCLGLCRVVVVIRREDTEARKAMEERAIAAQRRNNEVLDKVADIITDLRIEMAAHKQGFK